MRHARLTKPRFERLHPGDQVAAYCRHPDNLTFHRNRPDGLSLTAQSELVNDRQAALHKFWSNLPNR